MIYLKKTNKNCKQKKFKNVETVNHKWHESFHLSLAFFEFGYCGNRSEGANFYLLKPALPKNTVLANPSSNK